MMRRNLAAAAAALVIYCTIFLKLSYCSSTTRCPEIEQESLLSFKHSLKDRHNRLSSWKAEVSCCNWKGVVCNNITGHVHQLHLQSYDQFHGLRGKINPSLINLKHLRYLDLSQNNFEGTIPSFIGSLTSLEYLNLSHAGFYGTIPRTIGNLSNLQTLNLEGEHYASQLEWLSGLSKLEHLNMNSANLSKADNWLQVISTLPSLVELNFGYCSLNLVSPSLDHVDNVTSLAILDLSGNDGDDLIRSNLAILPKWIFQLNNLIFLDLGDNSFQGPIPTITNTTKLQHIDLSRNRLNSTIPDWLYYCKDLEFVYMSENYLQGPISSDIANLTSLNFLDLSTNQLSGNIPNGIANLCNIQFLDLFENNFHGEISGSFGNMSECFLGDMEYLNLSGNQLSGDVPDQFGEFKSLKTLNLAGNSLSGAIPINIGNISSLEILYLAFNKFTGNLPESVGKLFNLQNLFVEDNKLEGVVSENHFASLTKLKHLYASGNHLTLNVSPNWIPPFDIVGFQLSSWDLGEGAQFPSWLEKQKHIVFLDLSSTRISGNVPSWIWNIQFLNLSHNQLNGNIPVISTDAGGDQFVDLSSNQFSGSLPRLGANAINLDLSNNSLSGGLSHFLCDMMTNETYFLSFLHLGGNQLSGEIPDCWMKHPSLQYLNLGNNMFSGTIPNSIGFLSDLRSLNLHNNHISGQIPFSILNCTKLVKIDLANNRLNGTIPTPVGTRLANLMILILRSNNLSGEISPDICHLNSLQILDLSENEFSGIIPRCVDNFTAMATERSLPVYGRGELDFLLVTGFFQDSASVSTKGSELYYDIILPLVTNIDLSKNNLSGDIPKELTSLVELRSIDLSGNHLTGLIPQSIGDMKQLESLDLSRNCLSGEMPSSFSVMSSLNYLNVSFNNLTGRIPESTQLRGFDSSSFIGNDLCGPPLTSNCIPFDGPMKRDDNRESGVKSSKIEWVYVFVSLGYAVGFSVFCTTLVLKKSWREAYYEFMEEMWNRVCVFLH